MPPTDSTPSINTGSFELIHSLKAYDKIPIYEFKSKKTGLTVTVADVDGPVVNGYFCLATEAFDDDGIPHTLEHLIFLGSEDYPYKGVLDLLANRCLASGTNAWTDTDHTCYTMETAGSEGFLALMPIYLDHILYPVLADETFVTEVHHVTEDGEDAGVVYCEMQGRENSGESRIYLTMKRAVYPGHCGYSSETGGIMKNLRESITNQKIREYCKQFYRPENLKLIITGKIKHEELFKALEPIEKKILSKGDRGSFERPWQSPVPPLEESKSLMIKYPSDEEDNGICFVAWRGPSAVKELYTMNACSILLKYLTESSVSLLQQEFVEINDAYASEVNYSIVENSISCLYITFRNVPLEKLPLIKPKLDEVFKRVLQKEEIDMKRMKSIIKRQKLENLSDLENSPHNTVVYMVIGQMLYGNTKEDYEQRLNPFTDLDKMDSEPAIFWLNLLRKYLVDNKFVAIQALPSIEEKLKMNEEEKARIAQQIRDLGEEGLKKKAQELQKALEYNERQPPEEMLTSIPIPNPNSISYHEITRYTTDNCEALPSLANLPIYVYFDHVKTSFVYMYALMDTSKLTPDQRLYLPLLLEAILESPVMREGKLVPFEDVISEIQNDTVSHGQQIGLGKNQRFNCSSFSHCVAVTLQVESSMYERGVEWLRELLYQTVFTSERLKIIAAKILNDVAEAKRSGRNVVGYVMKSLRYVEDSNYHANGVFKQHKFLSDIMIKLDRDDYESSKILETMDTIRKIITDPKNIALYIAANLENLKPEPVQALHSFLPSDFARSEKSEFNIVPDHKLLAQDAEGALKNCLVGMGCLESSFFLRSVPSVSVYDDPDMPALLVYVQYVIQTEGPMWKQIRGKGYSYNYSIILRVNEGLLYLVFGKATNVVGAYKETYEIIKGQINERKWDVNLLEAAKSSLIFEMVENEATIGDVIGRSLLSYFYKIDYGYNRKLIDLINGVTVDDLNRVGEKYVSCIFDPVKVKTAVVSDAKKAEEIALNFQKLNVPLQVFPSLEESFLNK